MPTTTLARVGAAVMTALLALTTLTLVGAPPSGAHEERPASFPAGKASVPRYLGLDNDRSRVVCRPSTARRVEQMRRGALKARNRALLEECRFGSIQDAINSIKRRRTSIYVLPGVYRERKWARAERSEYCSTLETSSDSRLEASQYIGSITAGSNAEAAAEEGESNPVALSYADQRRCAHNLNLITIFGDRTPRDDSIACNSRFCGTQVVGTGRRRTDVLVDNRFSKLNAFRADRAGGVYVRNMTFQQAEFNAIYVLETDGFVLDRVLTRANDEYGILAFASDHGVIKRAEAYYNGDSGIYPGSASDLNGDSTEFTPTRYAIEIKRSRSHHNTLGYSGTAGNSVYAHHNKFHDNATGVATDSLFPGHPGLPQDHARWSRNEIYSNNTNYYTEVVDRGICDRPMRKRGYMRGNVCPVVPTPVGTGVLIAGGNFNSTDHNWIYDNWRHGTMQFWVPAALRDDYDPTKQDDTSHHNHTVDNQMGIAKDGSVRHNGSDHWWDDQGEGNCWEGNTYSRGERTDNFILDPPSCTDGGSLYTPGAPVKDAGFLSCSQYDRNDPTLRHPPACSWFDSPSRPAADGSTDPALGESPAQTGAVLPGLPVLGLGGLLLAMVAVRARRRGGPGA